MYKLQRDWNTEEKATPDRPGMHMTHCNQGEYEDMCKYGDDAVCPALVKKREEQAGKSDVQIAAEEYGKTVDNLGGSDDDAIYSIDQIEEAYIQGRLDERTNSWSDEDMLKAYWGGIEGSINDYSQTTRIGSEIIGIIGGGGPQQWLTEYKKTKQQQ